MKRNSMLAPLVAGLIVCGAAGQALAAPGTLAFVSIRDGNPHIYLKQDGQPERQLTHGNAADSQPAWSADGTQIAFTSTREGLIKVYVMDADGSRQRRVTADDRIEYAPSWSPDGKSLAFYSTDPRSALAELRILDLRDGKAIAVAGNGLDKGPNPATWSRDGRRLAFTGLNAKHKHQVWVVERDGSGLREISSKFSPRDKAFADISPDGRRVAYVADMRGGADLIVTDVESLESTNLTVSGRATKNENPRWSADGKQLLFGSTREDPGLVRMDVFVMNADGSALRNLTRHPHEDFDARWSADGRTVVFTSLRTGMGQLYAVDVAGGPTRRLTQNASYDMDHASRPVTDIGTHRMSLNEQHHQD